METVRRQTNEQRYFDALDGNRVDVAIVEGE